MENIKKIVLIFGKSRENATINQLRQNSTSFAGGEPKEIAA